MLPTSHYNVIVVGVGSMGSSACWFLAERGHKVLGLEQFDIVHEYGSHFGQSRIIRKAYFEHPDYVPLLERAYDNWRTFEGITRSKLYYRTGIAYMGRSDNQNIKGVLQSASLYKVAVEQLSPEQFQKQFPTFRIPSDFNFIIEPDAGFVVPEQTIRLYSEEAQKKGAVIKTHEAVIEWKEEGSKITVVTNKNSYTCDKLIITAGSWTSKIIPQLKAELKVTRQLLAWVNVGDVDTFSLGKFPCWFIEDPEFGTYYGFPVLPEKEFGGPHGLKLARHYPGDVTDPDVVNRNVPPDFEKEIRSFLKKYIPAVEGSMVATKSCLYTYSKDENFIIDHLPGYSNRVTVACGFSGHGFKFVPVVGEILADLSMKGKTDLPIDFLSLKRLS